MARVVSAEVQDALEAGSLVARDFLTVFARTRDTGDIVADSMWSDVGTVTAEVINPDTGEPEERSFYGAGTLISIDDIPLVSNITVQTVGIRMSQVHEHVQQLARTYDVQQARVEIFRGMFDPETRILVAPAECRFVGFVDKLSIITPAAGDEGSVNLTNASHTQEMTRSNPDTRSHESQIRRHATDNFFQDTGVVGDWDLRWGG